MIKDNILKVKGRIDATCSRINRGPGDIAIVAVTKGRTLDNIKEVLPAGITDIGENKVQEALLKYSGLTPSTYNLTPIKWHMVGHLQTNKVKDAVRIFDLIQSVDSLRLAQAIDKEAARIGKVQEILIEVKTSSEATKFGVKPEEVRELLEEAEKLKNIRVSGLMTIAPLVGNPEQARPYFRRLKELFDDFNTRYTTHGALRELSMGMSDDFEVAVEEGANMLRLGRAIFEG